MDGGMDGEEEGTVLGDATEALDGLLEDAIIKGTLEAIEEGA